MVDVRPPQKPYHHGDLAHSALQVAHDLLAEGGMDRFSLREVARRLEVSLTALYHHFPDKESLLTIIAQQGMEEFKELLLQAVGKEGPTVQDAMVRMGVAYVQFFLSKPYYLDLIFLPAPKQNSVICKIWDGTFLILTDLLLRQGWKEADVPYLGVWLWSSVHGLTIMLREGILGRGDVCPADSPAVFHSTRDELLARVIPLIASIMGQAVSSSKLP